jgi:hypothetical protein
MATSPWKELENALAALAKLEKPKKAQARKGRKPKQIHPKRWRNQPKAPSVAASDVGDPWKAAHGPAGSEPLLVDLTADAGHAIGGVLLDLAGEGEDWPGHCARGLAARERAGH